MNEIQQLHLLQWLKDPANYMNVQQSTAFANYIKTKGANPATTQALFSRFMAKQGIVRHSARVNGKVIKVYKQSQTKPCPTCFGTGQVPNIPVPRQQSQQ